MKEVTKVTRKELIDALCGILDGESAFDLRNATGYSLERCEEIMDITERVRDEWLVDKNL